MTTKYISMTDTAKLIRKTLKEAFPGVTFSVRCGKGSSSAINIGWTDGPSSDQVEAVVGVFQGGYFDGMTDYQGSIIARQGGEDVRFCADFIFCRRDYSDAAFARIVARVGAELGLAITAEQHKRGELYNVYPRGNETGWHKDSAQCLVNRAAARHTFCLTRPSATAGAVEVIGRA